MQHGDEFLDAGQSTTLTLTTVLHVDEVLDNLNSLAHIFDRGK